MPPAESPRLAELASRLAPAGRAEPVWIMVGTLIDGTSATPRRPAHLVYDTEAILHVGGGDEPPPRECLGSGRSEPDLRLPGCTVLPGLLEAHAHLVLDGDELDAERRRRHLRRPAAELLAEARRRAHRVARLGVTAVRDASDNRGVGLALSRESRSSGGEGPEDVLPRVDSPGPAIHHRGSHGGFIGEPIEAQPSLEACVESRVRAGADRLKLMVSGVIDFREGRVTAPPQMSAEEVRTLVRAAHERRRPVFAHASGEEGVETALAGDIESVEHGYFVTPDQLARMRDRRIAWVPTFAPVQAQLDHADALGWDGRAIAHLQRILDGHARALRHAVEIGVTVLAGSDAGSYGVPHGRGLLLELALMERAGMRTLDVLSAASGVSATHLGLSERLGALLPGRRPRFILTGGRPLETVAALGREELVIFDGRVLHPPKTAPSSRPSPPRQARGEPCP